MNKIIIDEEVNIELIRARKKFPECPSNRYEGMTIILEEVGELAKAIIEHTRNPSVERWHEIEKEAIQSIAMIVRLLEDE